MPTEHRFFAAIWDRMIAVAEKAGLAGMRRETVRQASGRTLELGAGTGNNLAYYSDAVTELVLTERTLRAAGFETEGDDGALPEGPADRAPAGAGDGEFEGVAEG